jgi:hypothetical protein
MFRSRAISKAVEITMYKTMVKPAVVFARVTWAVAEMDMKELGTWGREILRSMYGQLVEQGIWRRRTDQELREVCKNLGIVADIKRRD